MEGRQSVQLGVDVEPMGGVMAIRVLDGHSCGGVGPQPVNVGAEFRAALSRAGWVDVPTRGGALTGAPVVEQAPQTADTASGAIT